MAENNKIYTLDERIENNLKEIYDNKYAPLKKIIDFVEQYKQFELSGAKDLSKLFDSKAGKPNEVISTHGMPGFFAGDRDADTVMLMLNPGQDVALANNPMITYERIMRVKKIGKGININSLDAFISTYKVDSENYGKIDEDRPDNFDLKQAAFLKHWDGCGVDFAGFLDDNYKNYKKLVDNYKNYKKLGKADKEEIEKIKEEIEKINKEAKRNVLMQKLSMDLIPYASRKFEGINSKQMQLLFPYLETLFHEIFRTKRTRKYVIFCSGFYDNLFKKYNKWEKGKWIIEGVDNDDNIKFTNTVFDKKNGKERLASCTPITITCRKDKCIQQNAIIAHTFPNQSLPNAYERMEEYGRFCFDEWKKAFGEI